MSEEQSVLPKQSTEVPQYEPELVYTQEPIYISDSSSDEEEVQSSSPAKVQQPEVQNLSPEERYRKLLREKEQLSDELDEVEDERDLAYAEINQLKIKIRTLKKGDGEGYKKLSAERDQFHAERDQIWDELDEANEVKDQALDKIKQLEKQIATLQKEKGYLKRLYQDTQQKGPHTIEASTQTEAQRAEKEKNLKDEISNTRNQIAKKKRKIRLLEKQRKNGKTGVNKEMAKKAARFIRQGLEGVIEDLAKNAATGNVQKVEKEKKEVNYWLDQLIDYCDRRFPLDCLKEDE